MSAPGCQTKPVLAEEAILSWHESEEDRSQRCGSGGFLRCPLARTHCRSLTLQVRRGAVNLAAQFTSVRRARRDPREMESVE